MRASGLSLAQLAMHVAGAGLVIGLLTMGFGELVAPYTEEAARGLRLKATSSIIAREFRSGFWVKDDKSFVNIQDVTADTELLNLRIYEFDASYRLTAISRAEKGVYLRTNQWDLVNVELTRFDGDRAVLSRTPRATWRSALTPDILAVLKVNPERLSVLNLRSYIEHLRENRQKSTRYEIAFWNKFLYPIAGIALMILAIPFGIGSARAGGVGGKIVMGIIIGLAFHFASRLFSHAGLLNDWPALVSAGLPVGIVAAVAVGGLTRAERR
jgi:lipopolysaccharide export system permease protein